MNTKLTLTIEQAVIERAKSYAKEKGRSLSDIIENYLKVITKEEKIEEELSPLIKSLRGSFKHQSHLIIRKNYQKDCLKNTCNEENIN